MTALSIYVYILEYNQEQNDSIIYICIYFGIQGFRAAAEQQITAARQRAMGGEATEADLESLRRAALIIHDQYLAEKVCVQGNLKIEY
jgi:hypothetical protein